MDQQLLQADVNRRVRTQVPPDGWNVTVAIVVANRPRVHLLGTGSLFEIGGYHFVVTAAHVIKAAHDHDKTIGISSGNEYFISVHGNWVHSSSIQFGSIDDPFDVAVYRLPPDSVEKLKGKRFLRREDVDFDAQSSTAVFSLFGFPGIWAEPSRSEAEKVSVKALEYTTYAYDGATESLIGYDAKYHLLLGLTDTDLTQEDGSRATIVARDGRVVTIPRDMKGISGCAVWTIGDLSVPLDQWRNRQPKVVAVETGIYQGSQVVRATRWIAVTTLINEAFPELRPALNLWTP